MSVFDEPKIDCHNHILDPVGFPYRADTPYRPSGHEIATAGQLVCVMDTYGVRHCLVVGPNSGYGTDNRCLLDAIANSGGRLKGIAVVDHDISLGELGMLKASGIVGVAFNSANLGVDFYRDSAGLIARLADLDLILQLQFEGDQLPSLLPLIQDSPVRLLFDHCGRPNVDKGIEQPAFQALLALGRSGRGMVKLSGYAKFSRQPPLYADAEKYVRALIDAFTIDHCVWGSDWPFIRATERIDYGVLLTVAERLFPEPAGRRKIFWDNPVRAFGFGTETVGYSP